MAFPTDTAPAAAGVPVNGQVAENFALTQTVEIVPQNQVTILERQTKADGSEEMIVEVRKRFTRAVAGTGLWAEVAL